jgi:N-acetylglucosaminyl-diphospho-decaprenol L-rhamnosyltransferase
MTSSTDSKDRPLVSVIVVNWNMREHTLACLDSLGAAGGESGIEIIVVDNASSDGSVEEIHARYPGVTVIANQSNRMFAGGVNDGLRHGQGVFFLVLNPDVLITPATVRGLARTAEANPGIAGVSPLLYYPDGRLQRNFFPRWPSVLQTLLFLSPASVITWKISFLRRQFFEFPLDAHGLLLPVEQLPGACMLVSRIAVDRAGFMDEHFTLYYEDVDWCLRLTQHGLLVVDKNLSAVHHGGGSHSLREAWLYGRFRVSLLLFFRKHHTPAAFLFLKGFFFSLIYASKAWGRVKRVLRLGDREHLEFNRKKYDFFLSEFSARRSSFVKHTQE